MNTLEKFRHIHTFIFDVDGVLTEGSIVVFENGDLVRIMNIRDGFAFQRALAEGYRVVVITGGRSEGVAKRLRYLGLTDVYTGIQRKLDTYQELVARYELDEEGILYFGDDLPDYEVMRRVGLPACPADAVPEIKAISRYISPLKGGQGCARDVIEKVLKLHNLWAPEVE
jgi:3-deoxy-D-manno-octulosonate 8-phosphate phosphatase (KDO 8-P phosphatase)